MGDGGGGVGGGGRGGGEGGEGYGRSVALGRGGSEIVRDVRRGGARKGKMGEEGGGGRVRMSV